MNNNIIRVSSGMMSPTLLDHPETIWRQPEEEKIEIQKATPKQRERVKRELERIYNRHYCK